jgi:predicted anti-sigma-YlaC factor YlaD
MSTVDTESLSCQELVELVTDYLEHALEPAELARFEQHLAVCGKCGQYLEQLRQVILVTGSLTPDDLSPDAEEALIAAFRGWHAN